MQIRKPVRLLIIGVLLTLAAGFLALRFSGPIAFGEGAWMSVTGRDVDKASVAWGSTGQWLGAIATPSFATPPPPPAPSIPALPPVSDKASKAGDKIVAPLATLRDTAAEVITRGNANAAELPRLLPDELRSLVQAKLMRLNAAGDVQVQVKVDDADAAVLDALAAAGVVVERVSDDGTIVQGWIPATALDAVAALAPVKQVKLPNYGYLNAGSVMTEGDAIINADQVRSTFGVTGAGVRVGVISDGVGGIAAAKASGDLPASVNTTTCNTYGGNPETTGAEGTAILEIVHDIAPDAELWFGHFGMGSDEDFNDAVDCLAANTDVVIDDVNFYLDGQYDGTSVVSANTSQELNRTSNRIRSYSTSAGNQVYKHYQGSFHEWLDWGMQTFQAGDDPDTTIVEDTTDFYEMGPRNGDPLYLWNGDSVRVYLEWDDPFGRSSNDYDLGLWSESAAIYVRTSAETQDGNDDPVEWVEYPNSGTGGWFDIVIAKHGSPDPVTFDMYVLGPYLLPDVPPHVDALQNHNYNTMASSPANQSDAGGGVISVGAIDAADPGNDDIEWFSNHGPTNDGRVKPDVSAIDGVCVTGSGGFGQGTCQTSGKQFFGTSASAPHVAGVAALLLELRPNLKAGELGDDPAVDRARLYEYLVDNAADLGSVGTDNVFGTGLLDAYAAAVLGDVNTSGSTSMVDAMLIAQCVAGLVTCTSSQQNVGDVSCSNGMSMVDAMLIAQWVAGLISSFPCDLLPP